MTKLRYGSFLSSDSLRLDENKKIFSSLILINLLSEASLKQNNIINFCKKPSEKPIFTTEARSNKCNLIKLPNSGKIDDDTFFITSSTSSFIPLFINVLKIKNYSYEISVEHTHPPSEMLWGYDKYKVVNHNKEKMVKQIKKILKKFLNRRFSYALSFIFNREIIPFNLKSLIFPKKYI